jgi:hypothetical protein
MCFQFERSHTGIFPNKRVKIAKNDILVYKYGESMNHIYYDPKIEFRPYYHSEFKYFLNILPPKVILEVDYLTEIEAGYHTYLNVPSRSKNNVPIGIFKIPKKSRYYINVDRGHSVSNQLVYLGLYSEEFKQELIKTHTQFNGKAQMDDF